MRAALAADFPASGLLALRNSKCTWEAYFYFPLFHFQRYYDISAYSYKLHAYNLTPPPMGGGLTCISYTIGWLETPMPLHFSMWKVRPSYKGRQIFQGAGIAMQTPLFKANSHIVSMCILCVWALGGLLTYRPTIATLHVTLGAFHERSYSLLRLSIVEWTGKRQE